MVEQSKPKSKPLDGARVLELGSLIAGPFCGRLLGDFGAEVVKVEPPGEGDPFRQWGSHKSPGHSLFWPIQARNKKCITLDLRQKEGQEVFCRLVRVSDVIVENFRPGTLERWGLGYEQLQQVNPGIILVRVSGFGQTGPYRDKAGFGVVAEAFGGFRYLTGYPDQPPPRVGISLGDSLAGLFGALGAMMALYHRDVHGGYGQCVDVAIYEAVFAMLESCLTEYAKLGVVRERTGTTLPNVAPSNIYQTADDRWAVVAANADNVFRRLVALMGSPELAEDERFRTHTARGENMEILDELVGEWIRQRPMTELMCLLDQAGVPAGPINSAADIAHDPHYHAREMILTMTDSEVGEIQMPGIVPKLSQTPGEVEWAGSTLGEHNQEIYINLLGLSEEELNVLRAKQVV